MTDNQEAPPTTIVKTDKKGNIISKELEQPTTKENEPLVKSEPKPQNFTFSAVANEVSRTYIFTNNQQVKVNNVYGVSLTPDGGHRLLSRDNPAIGYRVASNWLTIIYEGIEDYYVFTE